MPEISLKLFQQQKTERKRKKGISQMGQECGKMLITV